MITGESVPIRKMIFNGPANHRATVKCLYPSGVRKGKVIVARSTPNKYSMTERQFRQAVEALQRGGRAGVKNENDARVLAAATLVIRKRRGISEELPWTGPTDKELVEFLVGLDAEQRRKLKQIAEGLIKDTVIPPPPSPGA